MSGLTPRGNRLVHAQALAGTLADGLAEAHRQALAVAPADTIEQEYDIQVAYHTPSRQATCSIDGIYRPNPPRISVARSILSRETFSLLHELAHHLQRRSYPVMRALQRCKTPHARKALEEDVCDAFAAEVLLPATLVDEVLEGGEVTAQALATLAERSRASRAACCVRLAQRLRGDGYVVLAHLDGRLQFCAAAGDAPRVARDAAQAEQTALTRAASHGWTQDLDRLTHRSGWQTPAMFVDAYRDRDWVYAVYQTESPSWAVGPIPPDQQFPLPPQRTCEHCGTDHHSRDQACPQCGVPPCPHCHRCACQPQVTVYICQGCWLQKPTAEFPTDQPLCTECHE